MLKHTTILLFSIALLFFSACTKQLDLAPVSSISDANCWKTADQFDAFITGIHTQFRNDNAAFLYLGELRVDIYGTDPGSSTTFTGKATQGFERMWQQTLTLDNAGVAVAQKAGHRALEVREKHPQQSLQNLKSG